MARLSTNKVSFDTIHEKTGVLTRDTFPLSRVRMGAIYTTVFPMWHICAVTVFSGLCADFRLNFIGASDLRKFSRSGITARISACGPGGSAPPGANPRTGGSANHGRNPHCDHRRGRPEHNNFVLACGVARPAQHSPLLMRSRAPRPTVFSCT